VLVIVEGSGLWEMMRRDKERVRQSFREYKLTDNLGRYEECCQKLEGVIWSFIWIQKILVCGMLAEEKLIKTLNKQ
jgi:hypothetical protein